MGWGGGVSSNNTQSPGRMNIASASASGAGPPPLKTAFSSRTGKALRISNGAVFGRILEEGVDVTVVLHDGEGRVGKGQAQGRSRRVVECVRDERVGIDVGEGDGDGDGDGDGFGVWTVWG